MRHKKTASFSIKKQTLEHIDNLLEEFNRKSTVRLYKGDIIDIIIADAANREWTKDKLKIL